MTLVNIQHLVGSPFLATTAMAPDMMHSLHASQSSMSSVLDLAPLSPKTLGETEKLPMNYEGSYKPARVGLQRALQSGQMRNPLQMRGWFCMK